MYFVYCKKSIHIMLIITVCVIVELPFKYLGSNNYFNGITLYRVGQKSGHKSEVQ